MVRSESFDCSRLIKYLLIIFPLALVLTSLVETPPSYAKKGNNGSNGNSSECSGSSCEPLPPDANACNTPAADKNPHCNGGNGGDGLTEIIEEIEDIEEPGWEIIPDYCEDDSSKEGCENKPDLIVDPPDPDIDKVKPVPPGGGTCNNPDSNGQNQSDQECEEPEEPGWGIIPDYCETDPTNPVCKNEENYCKDNPDDPTCKLDPWEPIPDYCLDDPEVCSMPGWGEIPDYCLENPEVCEKPGWPEVPDYCADDLGHIDCKEPELPEPPEETVACFAEDGTTVYISEDETCSVKTDAGKYSTLGYETVAMYAGSTMLLDSSDIVFETGTELFLIDSAKVIGQDFGINASASESDLAICLLNSSEVEIPFLKGSVGHNKLRLGRDAKLTVSGDIVFQDGDDAIDNEGEIVVDGSIKFGKGDDILRQLGPKMIVKKGIDFGEGNDILQTNGLLRIGDGPGGDDGYVVDGGAGFDEAYFWDQSGVLRHFPGYRVQNFERVYQQGGF